MQARISKKQEKHLLHQLYSGKLKIVLHGKKLKGEFALVKAHGRGENGWLLMKLSKKSIEQMTKSPDRVYGQNIIKKSSTAKDKKGKKICCRKKCTQPIKRTKR